MSLPTVGQAEMLAQQFAALLAKFSPSSVAVIGCAGGNGLEHFEPASDKRLVCVDINPQYIATLSSRYSSAIPGLELYAADVQHSPLPFAPVDFIYAALLFEYVDVAQTLRNLRAVCSPNGVLAVVLQLPSRAVSAVSPSPFTTLQSLAPAMRLVPSSEFLASASAAGFSPLSSHQLSLPSGKEFVVQGVQRRESAHVA